MTDYVHEQRGAVEIRVARVELGEGAGQFVAEYLIADASNYACSSWQHAKSDRLRVVTGNAGRSHFGSHGGKFHPNA